MKRIFFLLAASWTLGSAAVAGNGDSATSTVQARRADELVDSVGVNTHFGYSDRPYFTRFDAVATKLAELGVRHIRDGVDGRHEVADRMRKLHETLGIGVVQIVGARLKSPQPWTGKLDPAGIDDVLATIKSLYADANEAIEGPNEYDNTHKNPLPSANDLEWQQTLKTYTQALQEKVKADPVLKNRPVVGPSMAHAGNAPSVPDLSAFITFGNFHPYPGGWNPARAMDDYNLPKTRHMTGSRTLWATETGYQNAMAKPAGGHNPAPEEVAGKYGPRLVAEYFRRGIGRAYFYELLDEGNRPDDLEDNFGLLRHDLSEKPIFTGLKAMISILKDPGESFEPASLDYQLSPQNPAIHDLLLQKRDGRFYLLVWREIACYDADKRTVMPVTPLPVTIQLQKTASRIAIYLPTGHGAAATSISENRTQVSMLLADELAIVEIRLGR